MNRQHVETLPYSQFRNLVDQKKVKDLVIASNNISGLVAEEVLKDEKLKPQGNGWHNFTTTRVEDPELTNDFRKNGIEFKGKVESNWVIGLLSWILPLVFFLGIWGLLAKRMGGGMQQNLMAIGKSNA
jgi:cell division protease FtsH